MAQQHLHRAGPHLVARDAESAPAHGGAVGLLGVAESGDRQICRDAQSAPQSIQTQRGGDVRCGGDSGGPGPEHVVEQGSRVLHRPVENQGDGAGLLDSPVEAAPTVDPGFVLGELEGERDALVPEICEVLHDLDRGLLVVGTDVGHLGAVGLAPAHEDEGIVMGEQFGEIAPLAVATEQDASVGQMEPAATRPVPQAFTTGTAARVVAGGEQQQVDIVPERLRLDALQERVIEVAGRVGEDGFIGEHAQHGGAATGELLGGEVSPVSGLLDSGEDPLTGLLRQPAHRLGPRIQRHRDRGLADSGGARHVGLRGPAALGAHVAPHIQLPSSAASGRRRCRPPDRERNRLCA